MIRMKDVEKWYGDFHALKDINLSVRAGDKIVLCGPSGSGKSTLIRCINPRAISEGPHSRRRNGAIPQLEDDGQGPGRSRDGAPQFNLFPHLPVLQNCVLAPTHARKIGREQAEQTARRWHDDARIGAGTWDRIERECAEREAA